MFFDESIHAVSITISAFLAGLAISSLLVSRLSREEKSDTSLVFWLQIFSALYGALVLLPYELVPSFIDTVTSMAVKDSLVQDLLKVGLMWVYLFMPALFLGGAFPLINGLYVREFKKVSESTGVVYFIDTLGAVAGALIAGFVLLPIGLSTTVMVAIAINLVVCLWFGSARKRIALTTVTALASVLFVVSKEEMPIQTIANLDCASEEDHLDYNHFGDILF